MLLERRPNEKQPPLNEVRLPAWPPYVSRYKVFPLGVVYSGLLWLTLTTRSPPTNFSCFWSMKLLEWDDDGC